MNQAVQATFGQNGVATRARQTGAAAQLLLLLLTRPLLVADSVSFTSRPRAATKAATTILEKNIGCPHDNLAFLFFPNVYAKPEP